MGKTTSGESYDRCSYCGNWHTYSMQMCRDMVTNKGKLLEIDNLTKKLELYDKALIRKAQIEDDVVLLKHENSGLQEYSNSRDESIAVYRQEIKELKERLKGIEGVYEFANKLAQTMMDLKSSHVFFLMQQAFGDETEWSDVEDILNNIITLTAIKKACEEGTHV